MGRHRGIGMNRAKKRKISPLVPAPVTELEPASEESEDEPPAPEPVPSPPRAASKKRARPMLTALLQARKDMADAKKAFEKVERKWHKKADTYFADTYSPWSEPSVVARVRARLQQADDELDAARTQYHEHRRRYMAYRACMALEELQDDCPFLAKAYLKAMQRVSNLEGDWAERMLAGPSEPAKGFFARNNEGPGAVDLVARQLGLDL